MQNLILRRMVLLSFAGHSLEKIYLQFPIGICAEDKNSSKVFPMLVRRMKVTSFDAELNSASNELILITRQYSYKKFYMIFRFVVLAPWC